MEWDAVCLIKASNSMISKTILSYIEERTKNVAVFHVAKKLLHILGYFTILADSPEDLDMYDPSDECVLTGEIVFVIDYCIQNFDEIMTDPEQCLDKLNNEYVSEFNSKDIEKCAEKYSKSSSTYFHKKLKNKTNNDYLHLARFSIDEAEQKEYINLIQNASELQLLEIFTITYDYHYLDNCVDWKNQDVKGKACYFQYLNLKDEKYLKEAEACGNERATICSFLKEQKEKGFSFFERKSIGQINPDKDFLQMIDSSTDAYVLAFLSVFGNKNQAESMNFAFRAYWKNYKTVWALLFFQSQYDKKPYYEVTDGGDEEDYDEIDVLMWNLVSESLL